MKKPWMLFSLLTLIGTAEANDSTAVLEAGGLVYTTNSVIRIDSETLSISEEDIHVSYDFTNTGKDDIITLVAFPMPELNFDGESNYAIEPQDPVNWMGFRVWADGKQVRPKAEVRARRFGVDVTSVLARYGIPLIPIYSGAQDIDNFNVKMKALDATAREELVRYGLVDWTSQWGAKDEPLPMLHWSTHVAFYWFQSFPAGQTVHVEHHYRPVPGYSFVTREALDQDYVRDPFCVDDNFKTAFERRVKSEGSPMLEGVDIRYVLSTGANWLGPIGKFKLVIDKGLAGNLVSTCFSGLTRSGKLQFSFEAENFEPQGDVRLLLLKSAKDSP